jgi:hypothetical protein
MIKGIPCFLGKRRVLLRHSGLQERRKLVPVPPVRMEGHVGIWANEHNALVLDTELVAQVMLLVDKGWDLSQEMFWEPLVNEAAARPESLASPAGSAPRSAAALVWRNRAQQNAHTGVRG